MDEEIDIEPELTVFPPIETDMVVDDTPIILNNDDKNDGEIIPISSRNLNDYKEEMLKNGLVDSDVEYFMRAYKNLEEVKFIKIHCTGCDKHMGSAPNELDNRYQHPILKVLLCAKCYQFYCSGEFEKGEDESELYCRWCGEGGLVYCCTKCPFVFCKNCITRNLGRGTARIIENTEYWICFSCNPWQISRHRATYWAVQKYSEEMIAQSKITGEVTNLDVDLNICCQGKKRTEPCEKSRTSIAKKPKIVKVPFDSSILENALQNSTPSPSTSKGKKSVSNNLSLWESLPLVNLEPEDEVICTPDIIPIDESPPGSPLLTTPPPPLIPYIIQQQSVSKIQPPQITQTQTQSPPLIGKGKLIPISIKKLQKNVQNSFQKHVYTPITQLVANNSSLNLEMLNQEGLRIVHHPSTTNPIKPTNELTNKSTENTADGENDWFDKAIVECAEATEYVSTKIAGLAGVHSRAHKSERLMEELHNTLQTYIHVAIDKMRKIKRNMQTNFDKEMNKSEKRVNPFAKTKPCSTMNEDSSSQDTQSASEDDHFVPKEDDYYSTQDTDSTIASTNSKRKRKNKVTKFVPKHVKQPKTTKIQQISVVDDDVIFDMDVTNASDEEMESRTASSMGSEIHFQTEEVINIISSDDDSDVEEIVITTNGAKELKKTKQIEASSKEEVENKANKEEMEDKANKEEVEDKANKEEVKDKANEIEANIAEETTNENEIKDKINKTNENEIKDKTIDETNEIKDKNPNEEIIITKEDQNKTLTEQTSNLNESPDVIEDLIKKVETKFNIQNISSKDLLNYLSAKVILYNNRRAQKEFAKVATTTTNIKQFNVVETIEDILNTNNVETPPKNIIEMEEPCDVEEMLGSGVILRAKKSFGDEFSRFIGKSSESECRMIQSGDEDEYSENDDNISNNAEETNSVESNIEEIVESRIVEENVEESSNVEEKVKEIIETNKVEEKVETNMVPNIEDANKMSDDSDLDEAELFFNKDNESLSLPPDGIGDSITTNNIFATKETENSDLVLDSGILALKQMAENCVNPTVELRQASTECNG